MPASVSPSFTTYSGGRFVGLDATSVSAQFTALDAERTRRNRAPRSTAAQITLSWTQTVQQTANAPEPLAVLRGHGALVNASCFLAPTTLASGAADDAVRLWDLRREDQGQGRDGLVKVWDAERFGGAASTPLRWPSVDEASAARDMLVCPGLEGNQDAVVAALLLTAIPDSIPVVFALKTIAGWFSVHPSALSRARKRMLEDLHARGLTVAGFLEGSDGEGHGKSSLEPTDDGEEEGEDVVMAEASAEPRAPPPVPADLDPLPIPASFVLSAAQLARPPLPWFDLGTIWFQGGAKRHAKALKDFLTWPLAVLRGHGAPVNTSCFLAPTTLASGAADGAVRLWDLRGRDGLVKVWDAERFGGADSAPLASYYCGSYSFTKFAALRWSSVDETSAARDMLVCPGPEGNQVLVYDWRSAKPALLVAVPDSPGAKGKGMCMSLSLFESAGASPDSARQTFIGAGFEGGQLALLDLRAGGKIACEAQITRDTDPLLAFDVAQDGRSAICGSPGTELFVAQLDTSALAISSRSFFQCNHGGFGAIRIRSDQRVFATAGWDHRVRVFHARKLKPLAILKHHTESVFGLDFSPDSALLASASKDHKIALWSVYAPDAAAAQRTLRAY
ncbi:hypothetical protein PybrP1_003714 [[Pythium] brassicae (nom. inval.)]|nr:hypothetical protein PybrP1_003714 [[Pythium] brassicae (nom. inval.)]